MNIEFFKNTLFTIGLLLLQVLVFNQVHLFGCATPLIYIYAALLFPRDFPRWAIITYCFVVGLVIDMFNNTPGLAAGSMTLLGMLQPMLLSLFVHRDNPNGADLHPSVSSIGFSKFVNYTTLCVFIYCTVFFTLEAFSFFNMLQLVLNVVGSSLITILLIVVVETLRDS